MAGRLAVDFGTSNSVVAVWDAQRHEGVPLHLSSFGRKIRYRRADGGEEVISVVPSLLHYAAGGRRWLGNQVLSHDLYDSERTIRWMKRYVGRRSPVKFRIDQRELSYYDAAKDYLSAVLQAAAAEIDLGDEEVALTVPVEAFEHYEEWLTGVASEVGVSRFRLIDEASAAALGYGAHIRPGDVYLIFDFGGGTLDVAVVLIDEGGTLGPGQRCRVLGKAGTDLGGATVDQWLFLEVLRRNNRSDADEEVRPLSRALLVACERAKEQLSHQDHATVQIADGVSGVELKADFTPTQLEELLDRHSLFTLIDQTVRRALNTSRERGYSEENIKSVLMVGGSSLLPPVQRFVQRLFGRERVFLRRPLDAVARGAAAFVAGVEFYDHIQHDYALRFVDPRTGSYEYRVLVPRGTPYPTAEPLARVNVKASHPGQEQLGLALFEVGERRGIGAGQPFELIFDPSGAARVREVTPEEQDRREYFWVNEPAPTFLEADPPAQPGEPRFEVEFGIDGNKRLLMTARDLLTKRITHRDFPVVKLT